MKINEKELLKDYIEIKAKLIAKDKEIAELKNQITELHWFKEMTNKWRNLVHDLPKFKRHIEYMQKQYNAIYRYKTDDEYKKRMDLHTSKMHLIFRK